MMPSFNAIAINWPAYLLRTRGVNATLRFVEVEASGLEWKIAEF